MLLSSGGVGCRRREGFDCGQKLLLNVGLITLTSWRRSMTAKEKKGQAKCGKMLTMYKDTNDLEALPSEPRHVNTQESLAGHLLTFVRSVVCEASAQW